MGIKGLPKLISNEAGDYAMKKYPFTRFHGMTIAVDFSLILHQTVIAMRSSGKDMVNKEGELTSHLYGLFYKILIFLQNNITPIFVFDGKAPMIKNKTLKKRSQRRIDAEEQLKNLTDSESDAYIKNFKQSFKPSKENIKEAQILLDLMGIPYINAPGEADVVCAWLATRRDTNGKRYAKGVCSDDSDMLALGAPYLFKDMLRFMGKNKSITVISLNKTLEKMKLSMSQFTDLCVLLGCDYCDNIKNIGPTRALKLIKKYGSLEKILDSLTKKNESDNDSDDKSIQSDQSEDEETLNQECMVSARNYFRSALKEIDDMDNFVLSDDNLKLKKYQNNELIDFMCTKHDFDFMKIHNGIKRLRDYHEIMDVTRENTKHVHDIINITENYQIRSLSNEIEFLPSDDETDDIPSKKNQSTKTVISKQ